MGESEGVNEFFKVAFIIFSTQPQLPCQELAIEDATLSNA
jgi:hypothetical protein